MSAVLLRRLLSNMDDFMTKITPGVQDICKLKLIDGVQREQDSTMNKKICDCIAELAKCYLGLYLILVKVIDSNIFKFRQRINKIQLKMLAFKN